MTSACLQVGCQKRGVRAHYHSYVSCEYLDRGRGKSKERLLLGFLTLLGPSAPKGNAYRQVIRYVLYSSAPLR